MIDASSIPTSPSTEDVSASCLGQGSAAACSECVAACTFRQRGPSEGLQMAPRGSKRAPRGAQQGPERARPALLEGPKWP
eukprot:4634539-Pyramimonas_sp.AAC.2